MKKGQGRLIASLVFLLLVPQTSSADAWQVKSTTTDFGDKQFFLQTYFKSGIGTVPNKRPSGLHKQLTIACTAGYFEIGFFDIAESGDLITIGSPNTMKVKFDGKLSPSGIKVHTPKGSDYVQVKDPKALVKKLKLLKSFAVEISLASSYYRAVFDVADINKYSSKFAAAGCKI